MQCTAKSKRSQQQCRKDAILGSTKCYMHGGKSQVGAASSGFKHGRYSKHLPTRLAERYHQARTDAKLLELNEEIALLDSRLAEVLTRVDAGDGGPLWERLVKMWGRLDDDIRGMGVLAPIGEIITHGHADWEIWANIRELLQERRLLVESERKRYVELGQMITAAQAATMLGLITDVIRRHVQDRNALAAITREFMVFSVAGSGGEVIAAGVGGGSIHATDRANGHGGSNNGGVPS